MKYQNLDSITAPQEEASITTSDELICRADSSARESRNQLSSMLRKGVESILLKRQKIKICEGEVPSDYQDYEPWVFSYYRNLLVVDEATTVSDLVISGMLQPNVRAPDDYEVERKLHQYEGRLKCHFDVVHQVLRDRSSDAFLLAIEFGPGDGLTLEELRAQHPDWMYLGIGDRLFFSLEKLLYQFVRPSQSPFQEEFVRLFLIFIRREFRRRFQKHIGNEIDQQKVIDLNEVYDILLTAKKWLPEHFDPPTGLYMVSEEFEFDETRFMTPEVKSFFDKIISDSPLEDSYDFFVQDFLESLFCRKERLDLNRYPRFSPRGFVCLRFQDIDQLLDADFTLKGQVMFMFGCRSSSHLNDEDHALFIGRVTELLAPGGMLIFEDHLRSYNRSLRFLAVLNALKGKPDLRALALVDKQTGVPKSYFIERGIENEGTYEFISHESLQRMFHDDVEFEPIEKIYETFLDLNQLIHDILVENGQNLEAFRGINPLLYAAHEYLRKGLCLDALLRRFELGHDQLSLLLAIVYDLLDIRAESEGREFQNPKHRKGLIDKGRRATSRVIFDLTPDD